MLLPAQKTRLSAAATAAALCFAGLILRDTIRFGVDVPFWDLWDYVRYLRHLSTGELSWPGLLFARLGEHQIGMELAMSAFAWRLTSMHMPALMVWNWVTAALFCALAMLVTRRALAGSAVPWVVLAAAAFFVFNPAAYQVWLWALPLVHLLVPLMLLAGVWTAQANLSARLRILAAGALALAASFLLGSGLLLWGLFPLAISPYVKPREWRRERLASAVYALLLAVSVATYASGMIGRGGPVPGDASRIAVAAHFFLAYTGNFTSLTLAPAVTLATLAGAALALLFAAGAALAWARFRRTPQWPALAVWLSVGLYGFLSGGLTALARHGFGVAYAVESSRYVLASAFLPLACVAMGSVMVAGLPRGRLRAAVACGVAGVLAAGFTARVLQTPRSRILMNHAHASYLAGKVAVAAVNAVDLPQFRNIYSTDNRADFELSANWLNRRGWLRPPLWDERFARRLARPGLLPRPAFGRIAQASLTEGRLRLSGSAHLADAGDDAHAVIVAAVRGGEAKILAVFFPERVPGHPWSGEIAAAFEPGAAIRCFAYDAVTGQAHLLAGERTL